MRFPPEPTRELIRAKYWQTYYRFITLKRKPLANMRPFIVAGPPRSGTSLLCTLLNSKSNIIISNEPKQITGKRFALADPTTLLKGFLNETTHRAVKKRKILNKVDPHNPDKLTADTFNTGSARQFVPVNINPDLPLIVGVKAPTPLFDNLKTFCTNWPDLKALIIIRDPLRTINSWRNSFGWQPALDDPKAGPQLNFYKSIPPCNSPLEKRAHLWRIMAEIAIKRKQQFPHAVALIQYENLLADPQNQITRAAKHLGAPNPDQKIDTSFVRPQSRPNYKNLNENEISTIKNICTPAWQQINKATRAENK